MIGRTLSQFRITAKLGQGGMGEVYRAEDTRLGREVAIKVLPPALTADPERLGRLEREAKILASLNHPHIATLHQYEEDAGQHFLVMELVEGDTLAERIARGPLPVDDALAISLEITQALEAAHEHGIVHRDLKPANIKLTSDGEVKVLDFGIAKAMESMPSDPDFTSSPTMAAELSRIGEVTGTAAYMSPEQARGENVDGRTDVWAFGVRPLRDAHRAADLRRSHGRRLHQQHADRRAGLGRPPKGSADLDQATPAALLGQGPQSSAARHRRRAPRAGGPCGRTGSRRVSESSTPSQPGGEYCHGRSFHWP